MKNIEFTQEEGKKILEEYYRIRSSNEDLKGDLDQKNKKVATIGNKKTWGLLAQKFLNRTELSLQNYVSHQVGQKKIN